jgi:hypothetical protein
MSGFITATKATQAHYRTPGVTETVLRVSQTNGWYRWANGDSKDWYRAKDKARKMDETNYKTLTNKHRTLYSTLSIFHENIFDIKFSEYEGHKLQKSCQYVNNYTFGIDIDTVDTVNGHGINIQEPKVKEAVEAAAQFFCDRLREHAPNSVYCLFSGGGIYVFLHHEVLTPFFEKIAFCSSPDDYVSFVRALTDALNIYTKKLADEFFLLNPEFKDFVKVDLLNGAKRIFKTIFSIHKKHNFAVIPLNPNRVRIDFEKATLPLKEDVITEGKKWYVEYDVTVDFLNEIKPILKESKDKIKIKDARTETCKTDLKVSESSHEFPEYPPCIRNVLNMESCGVGATRALTFLATFLGHIEPDADKAYIIWGEVANRWHADAVVTNVFQSHYKIMHCASCTTLNNVKGGFPHVDIKEIGACEPNLRCMQIRQLNPIYYTDNRMYVDKLKADALEN